MLSDASFDIDSKIAEDDYRDILQFVNINNRITYSRFDIAVLRQVNLFALPEDFDFDGVQKTLDTIIKALPAIKRIFASPKTNIMTTSEILPIESVRVMNNETVAHASRHSELWENITSDGLKPRKLLTQDNMDNYATYENIMFARAIDMILTFVSRSNRLMNSILYSSRDMEFNLLERENHAMYVLAIGKLRAGYIRDYAKYTCAAEMCRDKLMFIDGVIRARLGRPVYKNCKGHTGAFALKKTNVFRTNKDYYKIYLLLKQFSESKTDISEGKRGGLQVTCQSYSLFCTLLSVFAAGNFNFVFPESQQMDFNNLDIECAFEAWRLRIETVSCGEKTALRFTFNKTNPYTVIILPSLSSAHFVQELKLFRERFTADEYLTASPFTDENDSLYLSRYDIDSFRRIQQVILRGMIASDGSRDMCPYCGRQLTLNGGVYECDACKTLIHQLKCPETGKQYFATGIKNSGSRQGNDSRNSGRRKLSQKQITDEMLHFRNITLLDADGGIICPKCKNRHSENIGKL